MNKPYIFLHVSWLISTLIFPMLVLGPFGDIFESQTLRLMAFALLTMGGSWLFRHSGRKSTASDGMPGWGTAGLITIITYAAAYRLALFIPDVSTYPFSLGWSEASRYYYASLFFSRQIYDVQAPLSVLHSSRYLMQSLPFAIPHSALWLHRLWQVILWLAFAGGAGWLLAWRLRGDLQTRWAFPFALWAALFTFQGPIYYHLLLMVVVVLWKVDSRRFWLTLVVVILASAWAGISRINWLPVPGMLAASLYLIEIPSQRGKGWLYFLPPLVWTLVGTLVGFLTQMVYQAWSGNPPELFGSAFESDLLWYRLLPNPTYPLGMLPSVALVSLPIGLLLVLRIVGERRLLSKMDALRILGLGAILFVLLAGGIVVSLKIGGGSNLHNMDAYLALLLVIGSYLYFARFQFQNPGDSARFPRPYPLLVGTAVAIPILFTITAGGVLPMRDLPSAQAALETINQSVQQARAQDGEVLFINQRHLLTFGMVENVPLIDEYELVFLMEMAMAGNQSYLDAFHTDLQNQRFALIISETLSTKLQGSSHSFGEENDAWVENVSVPVLCYYETSQELEGFNIQLYVPRREPCK
ncbi:MAG: hypothetical protein JW726_07030 [Anaerolineales bacterium]|nr:hypothetical protein [Anaerolineales bacterium]